MTYAFVDPKAALGQHYVLLVEFDSLADQSADNPEYTFPEDSASRLIAFITDKDCTSPEDLQEYVHWSDDMTRVQVDADCMDELLDTVQFLMWHTVPMSLHLVRNVGQRDI
jgi:hypothetical protein